MITLSILTLATVIVSAAARLFGGSKKSAILLGLIPMILLLVRLAVTDGLELGPHGGIFPAWLTVVVGVLFALVVATVVAVLVKKKEPIQLPETTRGK